MEMSSFVILKIYSTVLNSELSACASILNSSRGIAGVIEVHLMWLRQRSCACALLQHTLNDGCHKSRENNEL